MRKQLDLLKAMFKNNNMEYAERRYKNEQTT